MKLPLTAAMVVGILGGLSAMAIPCRAQAPATPPTQNAVPSPTQNSQGGPPPPIIPGSGAPGTPTPGVTTAATPQLGPVVGVISPGVTIFYGPPPVGRGLPGMPGGPALNGPMGAQDLSGRYMSPPAIGPTVCDLATLASCE